MVKRLAIITEGEGEYASLDKLFPQLSRASGNQLLSPLRVNVAPDAPARRIAAACRPFLTYFKEKGAAVTLLLFDREQQGNPARVAEKIREEVDRLAIMPVVVVLKDRQYENWLVADVEAFKAQPARFSLSAADRNRIVPNKADSCDALAIMKRSANGKPYHKVHDAKSLCRHINVVRAGVNSPSFRKFLYEVGHSKFASHGEGPLVEGVQTVPRRRRGRAD